LVVLNTKSMVNNASIVVVNIILLILKTSFSITVYNTISIRGSKVISLHEKLRSNLKTFLLEDYNKRGNSTTKLCLDL